MDVLDFETWVKDALNHAPKADNLDGQVVRLLSVSRIATLAGVDGLGIRFSDGSEFELAIRKVGA